LYTQKYTIMYPLIVIAALTAFASAIPSNVNVRPLSRTSVQISWHQDYDQKLKGFTIHYHNGDSRTTEWMTKTIWDPRASEAIIDGLRSEGEYSFCVRSIMTGRVCACSDLVHINVATGAVTTDEHDEHDDQRGQQGGQQQGQQQGGQQYGQQQGGYQQGQQQGQQQGGQLGSEFTVNFLEAGAIGGDYVQLRWRYDGPKPAKYLITYRGQPRYEHDDDGHVEEHDIETGAPIEVDTDHYVVHGLRPDTTYTFEVALLDRATGRPVSRPQVTRVTTKAYIL